MKTYKLNLTEKQLKVIASALEAYGRAQMGQFKNAIEQIMYYHGDKEYSENLQDDYGDYDKLLGLENIMKCMIFKNKDNLTRPHVSLGIGQTSEFGKVGYEIQCVIEQFLAVLENNGFWKSSRPFYEPIPYSNEPLASFDGFINYVDYGIPFEEWGKVDDFFEASDAKKLWELMDKYTPEGIRSDKKQVVRNEKGYALRLFKPEKIKKDE